MNCNFSLATDIAISASVRADSAAPLTETPVQQHRTSRRFGELTHLFEKVLRWLSFLSPQQSEDFMFSSQSISYARFLSAFIKSAMHLVSLRALRFAGVGTILLSAPLSIAYAYSGQWEWRAYLYVDHSGGTVSGPPTLFATKAEAVAAMQEIYPYSLGSRTLTQEDGVSSMTDQWVQYKFIAPRKDVIISDWTYYADGIVYPSEGAAMAAIESHWNFCKPPDNIFNWENWKDTFYYNNPESIPPWGSESEFRSLYASLPGCNNDVGVGFIERRRNITCPDGLAKVAEWTAPFCGNPNAAGYVRGHPIECVQNGPSTKVGNPCDVATGDKSQTESDYSGQGVEFTRYYHSQSLPAYAGLGTGWSHNYAASLVIVGSTPEGLVRADGHQEVLVQSGTTYVATSGSGAKLKKIGTEWHVHFSNGSREVYNEQGKLIRLLDRSGASTVLSYNSNGQLATVVGPYGHTLQLTFEGGLLARLTDPAGEIITYNYDTNGNLGGVQYQDGGTRIYHYEDSALPHHLTGITDQSGDRYATYSYDSMGRVESSVHAEGSQQTTLIYNTNNTTVTDAAGAVSTYTFTTDSSLSRRVTNLSRSGIAQSYVIPSASTDFQRRPTQETDARGVVTQYTYDAYHLVTRIEAVGTPQARRTEYQYWSSLYDLPLQIDQYNAASAPTRSITFTYDSNGNPLTKTVTDPTVTPNMMRTWSYTYDSYGHVLTEDGPRTDVSDVTAYTYYPCTTGTECGQLETITNALNQTTTYNTYNAHGQPLTNTDPNGVVMTLTYDARQRLTSRQIGSETTTFEYWSTGLLKKVTLPDNSYLQYTYDDAHRLTQLADGAGNKIAYTLDAMGNRTAENAFDPNNALHRTHSRVINFLNQLYQEINAAGTAAVTTTFGYDNNGNPTTINAPLGRNTTNVYDELDRLKQITDPASGITQFGYDANDNLTSVTDPRNLVTSYQYNGFGDLKLQTSPDTGTTLNTYDSGGNLVTATDARGAVATYAYDVLNRVTSTVYEIGGTTDQTLAFSYDAGTNGKGHLTGASDANHMMSWSYDSLGRVTGKSQTVGSVALSVGYAYTNGNLTALTTPSGKSITYGYNTNHQITSVLVNGTLVLGNVTYEPFGTVNGWTWGNGTVAIRAYDTDGNISQIASAGTKTYGLDDASRITSISDVNTPALSWTYGYDALDRATTASTNSQSQTFTYDANGNRLTQGGSASSTFTVNGASNRLSSVSGALTRTYAYNAAGAATGYGNLSFGYNAAGRMTSVTNAGVTTSYVYNALGQRVKKSSGGTVTYFAYDEAGHLVGEYNGSGALIQEIVWMDDTPVATLRVSDCGLSIFYIHTDHLNTPQRITRRSTTDIVWRWDGDPFGSTGVNDNPSGLGSFAFNLRFPGQYYDSETGLNYNYYRDYDPAIGRYVQSDPIGLHGGLNTYAYAIDNPLEFIDPYGLARTTVDAAIEQAVRRGDISELQTLLEASNPEQAAAIRKALERLLSKARDVIAKECKGSVNREFPDQLRESTLKEIMDAAKGGDSTARKALKLLTDSRFKK